MPELPPPRRIVTGHDPNGRGIVTSDGPAPASRTVADGASFHDLWSTATTPAPIGATETEPIKAGELMGPPANGTRVRIVDMPPGARSPMHRTESIDYGLVLEGVLTLVLDGGAEVQVGQGDLVVQRGTDHAWENRGETTVRVLFVLVAGRVEGSLRGLLPADPFTHDV
jgi:quercetin dioxygenase-like cupin family protein